MDCIKVLSNPHFTLVIITISVLLFSNKPCEAQLSTTFYDRTCPNATNIIRTNIRRALDVNRGMAASLIRLHFHDCFVQGCDASVLLDGTPTIHSEKWALPNANSLRGFEVIEAVKHEVEAVCPRVVSCADILTLAARDASEYVGGPSWPVKLGRRDSTTANPGQADTDLPFPFFDLNKLISMFANKGLNTRDMVALSGSHTLGQARCLLFRDRIYKNTSNINPSFASLRRRTCPKTGGDANLAPLDFVTPDAFDNKYYMNLVGKAGLLESDQILYSGISTMTDSIVLEYAKNAQVFASDFANSMIKMGEIQTLTGRNGIIRKVCNAVN